jgi:hypothetical protein
MQRSWHEEKQEALFQTWLSPKDPTGKDLPFQSPEAAQQYKNRIHRIRDAIQLKKRPDRVPVVIAPSFFPVFHAGMTPRDVMYDYDKLAAAFKKFALDFGADAHIGATAPGPGRASEIMDYKLYSWPGHGVAPEHSYQCNEGEYMKADEYDALIQDPSGFFLNVYLPRVFGALAPMQMLPFLPGILEIYGVAINFIPFGLPPVQAALKALMEAGGEALKWVGTLGAVDVELASLGYPEFWAASQAPFDTIGDTLRGPGIMLDIYRQPDKPSRRSGADPADDQAGRGSMRATGKPIIFIPLHKGADGFLSDEQYREVLLADPAQGHPGAHRGGMRAQPGGGGWLQLAPVRDPGPAQGQDALVVRHHRHGQGEGGHGRYRLHHGQRALQHAESGHAQGGERVRQEAHRRRPWQGEDSSCRTGRSSIKPGGERQGGD